MFKVDLINRNKLQMHKMLKFIVNKINKFNQDILINHRYKNSLSKNKINYKCSKTALSKVILNGYMKIKKIRLQMNQLKEI